MGCLEDDEYALLALLFITEITEYVPINPKLTQPEIKRIACDCGASIMIASSKYINTLNELLGPKIKIIDWTLEAEEFINEIRTQNYKNRISYECEGKLILHTSGSTGTPKRVPISLNSIAISAKNIAAEHKLTESDVALNPLPTFHIGALVDVLLAPLSVGGSVIITNNRSAKALATDILKHRPTWIQLVPTLLQNLVEELCNETLESIGKSLNFIRIISSSLSPDLKVLAEEKLKCTVIEMYGMTEAAGQISTNSRKSSEHKIKSVGRPKNVSVKILDAYGNPVNTGRVGEICICGPTVFGGYEGVERSETFFDEWFRTGDIGYMDTEGYLFLRGRIKEQINVGGEKVSPVEIEEVALTCPGIKEAVAYSIPHRTLGEQVGLTIACDSKQSLDRLSVLLNQRLAKHKQPRKILSTTELPKLPNSKLDRVAIRESAIKVDTSGNLRIDEEYSSRKLKIAEIWSRTLKSRLPNPTDDFFEMGGDSLNALDFLTRLEKHLGRGINSSQLFETPIFDDLYNAIENSESSQIIDDKRSVSYVKRLTVGWPGQIVIKNGIFRGFGTLKKGNPIFWSGQDSEETMILVNSIGKNKPVYVTGSLYQLPNRTQEDFDNLVSSIISEIQEIQPSGSIVLGGICGGAQIMQMVGSKLIQTGRDVKVIISSDFWPEKPFEFPALHLMTNSRYHSARIIYKHHEFSVDQLNPKGYAIINLDSDHRLNSKTIISNTENILKYIKNPPSNREAGKLDSKRWTIEKKRREVQGKIKICKLSRIYTPGSQMNIEIQIKNLNSFIWDRSEHSGLTVVVDLLNFDSYAREMSAGVFILTKEISPMESITLNTTIDLPNVKLPLIAKLTFQNQGIRKFNKKTDPSDSKIIFPNLFK